MDLIPLAHQISPDKRSIRDLMRTRLRLVQKRASCYTSIHRLLSKFNVMFPDDVQIHNPSEFRKVKEIRLDEEYQWQLNAHIEQIQLLNRQIKELEQNLYHLLIPNAD